MVKQATFTIRKTTKEEKEMLLKRWKNSPPYVSINTYAIAYKGKVFYITKYDEIGTVIKAIFKDELGVD